MNLEVDVERAVRYIVAKDYKNPKTDIELQELTSMVIESYKSRAYSFSDYSSMFLNQGSKVRIVKYYENIYSVENILCQYVKQILDRNFNIKYPNRNKTVRSLFSYIAAIKQMSHFTIVKFDFKDYFNSVSAPYVFEKYIKPRISQRVELDLLQEFCYSTKYAYAGLCTSNAISEIIAKTFDDALKGKFSSKGLLFFERYIDDCILLLNEHVEMDDVKESINEILTDIFHSQIQCNSCKCKTKFNDNKFRYLSSKSIALTPYSVDYLGYEFWFSRTSQNIINVQYGITEKKRKKYCKRVDKIIALYKTPSSPDYNNIELLRHRILAFASREVYINKHFKSNVWKVKGFISNYGELRYLLNTPLLENDTKTFLQNMIEECFSRSGVPLPYFLKTSGYNLFENLKRNKTLLFVDTIGYDYNSLSSLCQRIGISPIGADGKRRGYGTLVRDYLIKIKVGY